MFSGARFASPPLLGRPAFLPSMQPLLENNFLRTFIRFLFWSNKRDAVMTSIGDSA
jgi:hypothetical protein